MGGRGLTVESTTYKCRFCLLSLPEESFYPSGIRKHDYLCRKCSPIKRRDYMRIWSSKNKELLTQRRKEYLKNPANRRIKQLGNIRHQLRKYNLTYEEYIKLNEAQKSVCKICKQYNDRLYKNAPKRLAVDHCHKTGKVRGLLCGKCNTALGLIDDSIERCNVIKKYLLTEGNI